jgi:hypothetical protein
MMVGRITIKKMAKGAYQTGAAMSAKIILDKRFPLF